MGSMKGSQKTETSVPRFVEDGGRFGVDRAKDLAQMGYMPYFGPDVAALSPMQQAAMQNTNQAANAFGMQSANVGMPQAQDYGGFSAYSSAPMFTGAQDQLQERMPGLFEAYSNMFIDPQTGVMGGGGSGNGAGTEDLSSFLKRKYNTRPEQLAMDEYGDIRMTGSFMR